MTHRDGKSRIRVGLGVKQSPGKGDTNKNHDKMQNTSPYPRLPRQNRNRELPRLLGVFPCPVSFVFSVPIREGLLDVPESARRHLIHHQIDPVVVGHDMRIFFERSLARIIHLSPFVRDMPDELVLQQLELRAGGLFVWAATACRFVKEGGPNARKRLAVILQRIQLPSGVHPAAKLDEIYTHILRNALSKDAADDERNSFLECLTTVLGTIAVLFSSLPVPSLASLHSVPDYEVLDSLRDLHPIIYVFDDNDEPIRLHHASIRGFLLDHRRCIDARFRVDEIKAYTHLARQCRLFMSDNLQKNLCRLRGPGVLTRDIEQALLTRHLPPSLRYACLYWHNIFNRANTRMRSKALSTVSCECIFFTGLRYSA